MKIKLFAIQILLIVTSLTFFTGCKEDDDTDDNLGSFPNTSWARYDAKFFAAGDVFNMLELVEPCGQSDVLYFYDDGSFELYKNGCSNIYGSFEADGSNSVSFIKGDGTYTYSIETLNSYALTISYPLEGGTLIEYFTKN